MGQGAHIVLVNQTDYDWQRSYQHSYQMNSWDFPEDISAHNQKEVYVEWDEGIFVTTGDDGGEVTYTLTGTDLNFQVQARAQSEYTLGVVCDSSATPKRPVWKTVDLGWKHNGTVTFVLTNDDVRDALISPTSWMHDNLSTLGNKSLRQLCIPGSHDSGMSTFGSHTALASESNTLTQTSNIREQLQFGMRYFDIRPVISAGRYVTGHYGKIEFTWQGANGQSIDDIIREINEFTANFQELVILYLSHDLNTDVGNTSYRPFTQDEWNGLLSQLRGINSLFIAPSPTLVDLTKLKLNDYIGKGSAAVIVVVDPDGTGISLGDYADRGFYSKQNFVVINDYTGTDDPQTMISDQRTKMYANRQPPNENYFLLSWTLTQKISELTLGFFGGSGSIRDLANTANSLLREYIENSCSAQCYPNIIYIDNVRSPEVTQLAMKVNALT